MPFPSPVSNVPRADVGYACDMFLNDPAVTELDVHEQPDGRFTIVPRGQVRFLSTGTSTKPGPARGKPKPKPPSPQRGRRKPK